MNLIHRTSSSGSPSTALPGRPVAASSISNPEPVDGHAGSVEKVHSPKLVQAEKADNDRRWCDEVLYFAMTDRFHNGDPNNDGDVDPSEPERFHGGDWKGITQKLDDLKDLGATALWISPVTKNDRDFFGKDGFHGYWPQDFQKTEPSFGSMEDLKELIKEAHDRDMKVVIDLVLNHTGYNHPWTRDAEKLEENFHDPELTFHQDMVKGSLFGLPDLAQEKPEVAKYLIDMAKFWVRETSCDGFRLDAIMHFPAEFQKQFVEEMKKEFGQDFFILGEAYTGPPERVAEFQKAGAMDSVYDFPLSEALRNVAGHNEKLNFFTRRWRSWKLSDEFPGEAYRVRTAKPDARQLSKIFADDHHYPDPHQIVTLVENHDMPRFITAAGPDAKAKFQQALAIEFSVRGIPLLYYGAEDGMGLEEDDLRADKRHGADPEMRDYIKQLAQIRKESIALRRGEQEELHADKASYAFARRHSDETVVVAANFRDRPKELTLEVPGKKWQDALTGEVFESPEGKLKLDLEGRRTVILKPL